MKYVALILLYFLCASCSYKMADPAVFNPFGSLADKLIHRCAVAPSGDQLFYTVSDREYKKFDILYLAKSGKAWSDPKESSFNSSYSDHGMSFSPDGNTIYFSSTRHTGKDSIPETWHIWRSDLVDDEWSEPQFVDIPNLRYKLASHPSVTSDGELYFHASNLDYSDMHLYSCSLKDGRPSAAQRVIIPGQAELQKTTPFVSPKGDYLIYATVEEDLELYIAKRSPNGNWSSAIKFSQVIYQNGKGNPYVHDDYLYYTVENAISKDWQIMQVKFNEVIDDL